ncbi:MAG: helix-turn-helix transcriptional regulator [Polyangia bacterium]|jgi:transcriptional regulator with XRE-family HTH domain|nr:helix-turn-helix transcriptional regulator [Polyangia bacterium]
MSETSQQRSVESWRRVTPASPRSEEPRVGRIRQELGAFLAGARAEAGLGRKEVAARMGYQSLDRGAARLARWERGEEGVWGDRIPLLAAALGVSAEEIGCFGLRENEEVKRAAARDRRAREADCLAVEAEARLLALHTGLLMERVADEETLEGLPDIRLLSAGGSIMLFWGGSFSLHTLLRAWRRGLLTRECDCCGGPLRLFWVAGSPLSGAHDIQGICQGTGLERPYRLRPGERLHQLVAPVIELRKGRPDRELRCDLTLVEVLGILGVLGSETPLVRIMDAEGESIAFFDARSGTIAPLGVEQEAEVEERREPGVARPGPAGLTVRVSEGRGPARAGRGIVIGSVCPLSFGLRLADRTWLIDRDGREWRLCPGHIQDPDGEIAALFDGPVPPAVAAWAVARALRKREEARCAEEAGPAGAPRTPPVAPGCYE